jgi:hypothetical protein
MEVVQGGKEPAPAAPEGSLRDRAVASAEWKQESLREALEQRRELENQAAQNILASLGVDPEDEVELVESELVDEERGRWLTRWEVKGEGFYLDVVRQGSGRRNDTRYQINLLMRCEKDTEHWTMVQPAIQSLAELGNALLYQDDWFCAQCRMEEQISEHGDSLEISEAETLGRLIVAIIERTAIAKLEADKQEALQAMQEGS